MVHIQKNPNTFNNQRGFRKTNYSRNFNSNNYYQKYQNNTRINALQAEKPEVGKREEKSATETNNADLTFFRG